jgi:GTP-binding protein YchF
LAKSARVVGSQIEVTDIAGLIEGASKGAGLGNAFLADIRAVDAIFHVVRCYEDADILHVLNSVDPLRDVALINNELLLADLQSIDKRLAGKAKAARTPEAAATQRLLLAAQAALQDGKPARALEGDLAPEDVPAWRRLHLLTQKPVLYVCNVSESDAATGNAMTRAVADFVNMSDQASDVCVVAAGLEAETAALAVEAEREEFLRSLGLRVAGVTSLLQHALKLLRLQCFYTQGPTDARCWSIPLHATALDAAAAIHTDFAKGFIKAEIIGYEDFIACGGEAGSRAANKVRAEGKAYTMQDGDICEFKFHA